LAIITGFEWLVYCLDESFGVVEARVDELSVVVGLGSIESIFIFSVGLEMYC